MEVSGELYAPAASTPQYSLIRWLGEPQSRSGHGGERKNSLTARAGNWTTVVQPVA